MLGRSFRTSVRCILAYCSHRAAAKRTINRFHSSVTAAKDKYATVDSPSSNVHVLLSSCRAFVRSGDYNSAINLYSDAKTTPEIWYPRQRPPAEFIVLVMFALNQSGQGLRSIPMSDLQILHEELDSLFSPDIDLEVLRFGLSALMRTYASTKRFSSIASLVHNHGDFLRESVDLSQIVLQQLSKAGWLRQATTFLQSLPEAFLNNPKIQLQALYVYLSARDRLSADIVFKNACKSFENDNKEPQDLRAMFSVMARIYAISNSTSKIDELIDLYKAYWGVDQLERLIFSPIMSFLRSGNLGVAAKYLELLLSLEANLGEGAASEIQKVLSHFDTNWSHNTTARLYAKTGGKTGMNTVLDGASTVEQEETTKEIFFKKPATSKVTDEDAGEDDEYPNDAPVP